MEFLGKLGIDWHILVAQIINFVILLIILNKYLYRPVLSKIKKEKTELEKLIEEKEIFEREKKEILSSRDNNIKEAKLRAKKIIKEAEEISKEIKIKAKKEVELEKKAIIQQLKKRL